MPNFSQILREEILRLARRVTKADTAVLRKQSALHRHAIAQLKRQVAALQKSLAAVQRGRATPVAAQSEDAGSKVRFTAKGLASLRKRWDLSAEAMGRLLGVSGQAIYLWEASRAKPRRATLTRLAALRGEGKRAIAARLAELPAPARKATKRKGAAKKRATTKRGRG